MTKIKEWTAINTGLKVSIDKTAAIHFGKFIGIIIQTLISKLIFLDHYKTFAYCNKTRLYYAMNQMVYVSVCPALGNKIGLE